MDLSPMGVKYAIGLPTVGDFGDVRGLVDLAVSAERHGWDGVHLWDHVLYHEPGWPVTSSTVAAAAIAAATGRIRIILTVVLPRRQVQEVAQDTAAIDALSGRRLTVLTTIGSMDREYTEFGLDPDMRARGRTLDERLDRLTELWARWGVPRVPVWCGGRWPHRAGLRRAARFDGAMPTFDQQRTRNVAVDEFAEATSFVRTLTAGQPDIARGNGQPDIALEGATEAASAAAQIAPYAAAGMTWWIEALGWWRGDRTAAASRILQGPPAVTR
ncbi:LLM class flavin-dependent oxidoreductase [Planobispora rosea]|uniref:LLM class flavin-dependent oxidoreductase n=1 Tax=Planobispora rosea TaxID=35762 RepID=UPI00083B0E09|nr:LLM class flavin-dependent oxidoreductase [Planobispora rosea]